MEMNELEQQIKTAEHQVNEMLLRLSGFFFFYALLDRARFRGRS